MKPTLGLTGLTVNAMALIAPGAFLWLTFEEQALYGGPAASAMVLGLVTALILCYATAVSYAELSRLYPGAGSSYFYAEQAFLAKTKAFKFARVIKFFTGWASHLYYWAYPGLMVGVTAVLIGWLSGQLFPNTFSTTYNSPLEMILVCIVFALGVAYIAYRGVNGSTAVNIAINIIQITALVTFGIIAIAYRNSHPQGSTGFHLSNGVAVNYQVAQVTVNDDKGNPLPVLDANGKPTKNADGTPAYQMQDGTEKDGTTPLPADANGKPTTVDKAAPFTVDYGTGAWTADSSNAPVFNYHPTAKSVISPHKMSYVIVQACVAILLLVGFESVTSMGEEAKDPKRHLPWAILLSLTIQGAICYLFEYFATNYLLNSGYSMGSAGASGAPIGDLMVITGTWLFGSYAAGRAFMLVQAFTVFLALIGTTLACMNTGARVTYAMGRDNEVGAHFGILHGKTLTPHRSIWTLAILSVFIGIATVSLYLGGQASDLAALDKHNIWYSFGIFSPHAYTYLPNSLLIVTLISNFGTFLLYMTTCIVAIVAFKEHHMFNGIKHFLIPIFGVVANFVCMLFYLIGPLPGTPFQVAGMSYKEPYIALGVAALWGAYGLFYFLAGSKAKGREVFLSQKPA
jgi:amino acid transporter